MTGNQLVVNSGSGKMNVISAHAHELVFVSHLIGWKGNADHLAAGEVRIHPLAVRRHHLNSPGLLAKRRNGQQLALLEKLLCFKREFLDEPGLVAGFYMQIFHMALRLTPIVPKAELARSPGHLTITPGKLLLGNLDQLRRSVGDHLALKRLQELFGPDRISDQSIRPRRLLDGTVYQLLLDELGVFIQPLIDAPCGPLHPPGEKWTVAIIKTKPSGYRPVKISNSSVCPAGLVLVPGLPGFLKGTLEAGVGGGDQSLDILHMSGDLLSIGRLQATMGFELLDDRIPKGQQREHLGIERGLPDTTLPGVNDLIAKQQVIDLPVAAETGEINLSEFRELLLVEVQLALMVVF